MSIEQEKAEYWRHFYQHARVPVVPSQFAVFAISELEDAETIIDVGCGSGRDSFFFVRQGLNVVGIDASKSAVDSCLSRSEDEGPGLSKFVCIDVSDDGFAGLAKAELEAMPTARNPAAYARFFVHALTEAEEVDFLEAMYEVLNPTGGKLAVEFRTSRDREQVKETPAHYRRFVDVFSFVNRAQDVGFDLEYFVEGFGYAKHRADDAHVARCILIAN